MVIQGIVERSVKLLIFNKIDLLAGIILEETWVIHFSLFLTYKIYYICSFFWHIHKHNPSLIYNSESFLKNSSRGKKKTILQINKF